MLSESYIFLNFKLFENIDLWMIFEFWIILGKTVESKELWKEFIGRKAGGVNKIRKRDSLNVSLPQVFILRNTFLEF